MERLEGEIYCNVHGCSHAETDDPYGYEFALSGEKPECSPEDWSKLWVGASVTPGNRQ